MDCIDLIKGSSRIFGIIGHPVSHSFSPVLQNSIESLCQKNSVYVAFPVEEGQVKTAIKGGFALGIQGFNVTVPFKVEVMDCLCEIDPFAKQIGAVNTLKRMSQGFKGYNTDILGMEKSLTIQGISLKGKRVAVLGAGGAAHAAVILAASRGAKKLQIVNRTIKKAENLLEHVKNYYNINGESISYTEFLKGEKPDILIQTTSCGMGKTAETPLEAPSFFNGIEAVLDIIYTPWETRFLADAKKAGCIAINGFDMLLFQGIASYEIWNDVLLSKEQCLILRNNLTEYYQGISR